MKKVDDAEVLGNWWKTSIIDMEPGRIEFRGHPIQDLIGKVTFPQMIWLMIRGDLPSLDEAALFEAALVAAVDHGPQAPSIAAARMAITCGLSINNAMGSAVNMLGDIHGGAGEQCAELFYDIDEKMSKGLELQEAVKLGIDGWNATHGLSLIHI